MTYGPVAALLVELFPSRIRYTSMSIPYHIGTGYFGGFLPLISQYHRRATGDPFAGLWYTVGVVAMALRRRADLAARDRRTRAGIARLAGHDSARFRSIGRLWMPPIPRSG